MKNDKFIAKFMCGFTAFYVYLFAVYMILR